MKSFVFGVVFVALTGVFFVGGLLGASTAATMIGFCGWTPAVFLFGFGVAGLLRGKRLVVVNNDSSVPASAPARRPRAVQQLERTM